VPAFCYVHQFLLMADTLQLNYYFTYAIPSIFLLLAFLFHSILSEIVRATCRQRLLAPVHPAPLHGYD
jgi:hypothetical protein